MNLAVTNSSRSKRIAGYLLAVALPCLAVMGTKELTALHGTPLALSFVAGAIIGTLFDLGPSVVAVAVTAAVYNHELVEPFGHWSLGAGQLMRTALILLVGLTLVAFGERRRRMTDRLQQSVASLAEQTQALAQAQQGSNSAAWTFDARTRKTLWYPGGKEIFGCSLDEISAMGSPNSLVAEEDRSKIEEAAKRTLTTGAPFRVSFRVPWPNGEIHWLEANGVPVNADHTLWRGVTMDITDRKQTEIALVRAEKLAAAGRLASCIAHELNNPLTAVTNLIYLAKGRAVDEDAKLYLSSAESELRRLAEISSQTLRFHRQSIDPAASDLREMLGELLDFYANRLSQAGIQVHLEPEGDCVLTCLQTELRQVLSTLIRNAIDAMPNGGCLRIRAGETRDWRGGGEALRVTVADTGHGMSDETLRHLYEPFFTTKADVGAGLGLWVASGIVERHRGRLGVRSSIRPEGSGSVFRLVLPRWDLERPDLQTDGAFLEQLAGFDGQAVH
jgi:PAS domain S-box-containing protein